MPFVSSITEVCDAVKGGCIFYAEDCEREAVCMSYGRENDHLLNTAATWRKLAEVLAPTLGAIRERSQTE